MANRQGEFIWYELMTSDPDAAARFYGDVIGWGARPTGQENGYRIFQAGASDVAGCMPPPQGPGNVWLGYIGVDDTDRAVERAVSLGAKVHVPPTDIPGVGRFSMLEDPQGAMFYVMRETADRPSEAFAPDRVGHCQWNELSTSDPAGALDFYVRAFGWEKGDVMPMGEAGGYQFVNLGGEMFGAIMRSQEVGSRPMWSFYFGVADIDRAAKAVADGGGTVAHGPAEIPGGDYIIVASDRQGAQVGFVGPKRA